MRLETLPQWVFDAVVMTVAVVHLVIVIDLQNQPLASFAMVAVAALLFRRQAPLAVFLITLPPAAWVGEKVASMLALYALAYRTRRTWLTVSATVLLGACFVFWSTQIPYRMQYGYEIGVSELLTIAFTESTYIRENMYLVLVAAIPAILGYLQRTRRDLAVRLWEITEAREHEQLLLTQQALAAERAQLAREMHDVVSHQVSLIAVQAGVLQLQTKESETRQLASTIRRVSVKTLEELRHMVRVLRASGVKTTELAPQPTIGALEEMVDGSGIDARLEVGPLPEVDPPLQRAIYRIAQEGLTNVRKHAPGAKASVRVAMDGDDLAVEVVNSASERPSVKLPSSQYGLMGLRQRAELLGGAIDYGPTEDDGWRLWVRLPLTVTSADR